MSLTSFDYVLRSGLWAAYNHTCFFCSQALDWNDLHIDHLIPESFAGKVEILSQVKIDYNLDIDFQVNSLYNLVPAHAKCNLRKKDNLFSKATLFFYFELTKSRLTKVEAEIKKLRERKNKGQIISKLQTAMATRLINLTELDELLETAKQKNWSSNAIVLPHEVEFIDEIYDSFYLGQDYTMLYEKELMHNGVKLTNEEGRIIGPKNLKDLEKALKLGFYPKTNVDIKMSSSFTYLEELLCALKKAKMPKISFLSEPWLDIDNLDFLSPSILHDFEGRLQPLIADGISVGELVRRGIVKVNPGDYYKISLEYQGMETSLLEQFRADFNDDGIEDVFVKGWCRAVGGTLGFAFTDFFTRYSHKHLIESAR